MTIEKDCPTLAKYIPDYRESVNRGYGEPISIPTVNDDGWGFDEILAEVAAVIAEKDEAVALLKRIIA